MKKLFWILFKINWVPQKAIRALRRFIEKKEIKKLTPKRNRVIIKTLALGTKKRTYS